MVTDTADESLPLDFNRMRDADGRFSRAKIVAAALRRPARISGTDRIEQDDASRRRGAGGFSCRHSILRSIAAPATMQAAVYTGDSKVSVESVPTPAIGPGELLIRVESCGICHTDLKKIEYNLLAPPRIYGHETAGVVAAVGAGVTRLRSRATA